MTENEFEKIKEQFKNHKPKSRFETYQSDLLNYLISKLEGSNVSASTLMEIAQFAMYQTAIVVNDEVRRACKEMRRETRTFRRGVDNGSDKS